MKNEDLVLENSHKIKEDSKSFVIEKERYELEMKRIKANPRDYVCKFMENNLLHVGSKAFSFISLMPVSLVLKDLTFKSSGVKPNFNLLLVGNPSIGKTTIANMFCKMSITPIKVKKITNAHLVMKLIEEKIFSVSIDDFANLMNDSEGYSKVKTLEGALGDDRMLSAETMKYQTGEVRVQGVGLIGITPLDLAKYIDHMKSGLFSRMSVLWVNLTQKQNKEIITYMNDGIGDHYDAKDSFIQEKVIIDFYNNLFDIQFNKNNEISRVEGYVIDKSIKREASKKWDEIMERFSIKNTGDFKRDLHDFYRFLIAHAFLNIYNRNHEEGILKPNKEDCNVALDLMEESLKNKIMLSQIQNDAKVLKNPQKFLKFIEAHPKMRGDVKELLAFLSGNHSLLNKLKDKK